MGEVRGFGAGSDDALLGRDTWMVVAPSSFEEVVELSERQDSPVPGIEEGAVPTDVDLCC